MFPTPQEIKDQITNMLRVKVQKALREGQSRVLVAKYPLTPNMQETIKMVKVELESSGWKVIEADHTEPCTIHKEGHLWVAWNVSGT